MRFYYEKESVSMSITKSLYGKTKDGHDVELFTLKNSKGITVKITNFGGIITSIEVPDRQGKLEDVILGYDKLESYLEKGPYFGAIVGRHANRIENATFEINGIKYEVAQNDGKNHLHGGIIGFDKALWTSNVINVDNLEGLELTYLSKDGEEGYPGNLNVKVIYTLNEDNGLEINYKAISDKDTVVNLTNHAYFNLAGHASGNVLKHKVCINADKFTVNDEESIPTGEIKSVLGTPMDFRNLTEVGLNINNEYDQLIFGNGYDHNWVINRNSEGINKAAEVYEENSGRVLEVYTTKPGIQLYTGNFLESTVEIGKGNYTYKKNSGLCLETQYYPNSTTHKHFPSPILKAGSEYNYTTIYKFSTR